ncbi:Fc receptor-like protein 5 [Mantella aurantiaca]
MCYNLPLYFRLWLCLLGVLKLCEGHHQRPSISFSASYATYLTGEPVVLQCQATVDFSIHGYKFFRNDREIHRLEISSNRLRIFSAKTSDAGSYSCLYWVLDSRGKQESDVSFPISLTILDQPSQPHLLVKPRQPLYFEGESVTLECEHPHVNTQVSYQFQKDSSKLDSYHDTLRSNHHIEGLSIRDSGTYNCQYSISGHQRTFSSPKSIPEAITVTALSSSPRLNFLPAYATFIIGENVTMECVAPSPVPVTLYRFYKEGEEIRGPLSSKGLFSLYNITKKDQAEYTCMYWSPKTNREIPSSQSNEREIYVIDHLRPPLLSADPPSGRIKDGGNVTLYCIIRESYKRAIFHFLNETDELTSVHIYSPQTRAAAITINLKKNNNTSPTKYTCQYTAEIKGRLLLSPKSPQIEIIVITTGSLLWLIAIGVAAGIAVLIIIVGLVYWVHSGKKDPAEDVPQSKTHSNGGCKVTSL